LLKALHEEIGLRKDELKGEKIDTIYFGGGTPSILEVYEINKILEQIFENYSVNPRAEITLEANPDDLIDEKIKALKTTDINRCSIGVQSFFEEDLLYMNRAHNARESERAIKVSQDAGFENLTIDLIYGTPTLTDENWINNLRKTVSFNVPHVSSYALTVEEKTPLAGLIKSKKRAMVDDERVADHFKILSETLPAEGFEHYEISNFAKPGFRSKHNSSYWSGKPYLGFGPSAHSYNGQDKRRWNVANNAAYIQKIKEKNPYFEEEILSDIDRFNEFIMTRIRLIEGISIQEINLIFGTEFSDHIYEAISKWKTEWYAMQNNFLRLTPEGKIISDSLASGLFLTKS